MSPYWGDGGFAGDGGTAHRHRCRRGHPLAAHPGFALGSAVAQDSCLATRPRYGLFGFGLGIGTGRYILLFVRLKGSQKILL